MKQVNLIKLEPWRYRYSHGGVLRNFRNGRGTRALSTKSPLHLVFKSNRIALRGTFRSPRQFRLIHQLLRKYSRHFCVKVEQVSIQGDHLHLLIRTGRRSLYKNFFRVMAGQIAQVFEREGLLVRATKVTDTPKSLGGRGFTVLRKIRLWKYRPFTRIVKGRRAHRTIRDYIQLNEKEARGEIPYKKDRLKGLTARERQALWD